TVVPGTLSLVAGQLGGTGNIDGIADKARFSAPSGVAFDGVDSLYVAENYNHVIRKLVLTGADTGKVTTFAGEPGIPGQTDGLGSAAHFDSPNDIVCDPGRGVLSVADFANNLIRRITLADGQVSTFIGSAGQSVTEEGYGTLASILNPTSLSLDN